MVWIHSSLAYRPDLTSPNHRLWNGTWTETKVVKRQQKVQTCEHFIHLFISCSSLQISEAFEVLDDKHKCTIYDQFSEDGLKNGCPSPGPSPGAGPEPIPFSGFSGFSDGGTSFTFTSPSFPVVEVVSHHQALWKYSSKFHRSCFSRVACWPNTRRTMFGMGGLGVCVGHPCLAMISVWVVRRHSPPLVTCRVGCQRAWMILAARGIPKHNHNLPRKKGCTRDYMTIEAFSRGYLRQHDEVSKSLTAKGRWLEWVFVREGTRGGDFGSIYQAVA